MCVSNVFFILIFPSYHFYTIDFLLVLNFYSVCFSNFEKIYQCIFSVYFCLSNTILGHFINTIFPRRFFPCPSLPLLLNLLCFYVLFMSYYVFLFILTHQLYTKYIFKRKKKLSICVLCAVSHFFFVVYPFLFCSFRSVYLCQE